VDSNSTGVRHAMEAALGFTYLYSGGGMASVGLAVGSTLLTEHTESMKRTLATSIQIGDMALGANM